MKCCQACGAVVDAASGIGRRAACLACGADLHCCRNCRFYAPGHHNDCLETQSERVVDKTRGNFCDYFAFADGPGAVSGTEGARARLDALFRKKT